MNDKHVKLTTGYVIFAGIGNAVFVTFLEAFTQECQQFKRML